MKKLIAFAVLLVVSACAVYAASDAEPWESVNVQRDHKKPVRFNREANFGGALNANFIDAGAMLLNGQALAITGAGTLIYDFPTLGGASAALDTVCAESSAGTATGCAFGNKVMLGVDQILPNAFGTVNAYVSASGAFKVRACAAGITDGGSFNMPDASYSVTCIQ